MLQSAVLCAALFTVFAAQPEAFAALDSGAGDVGTWELLWRYEEGTGVQNQFVAAKPGAPFPIRWRVWRDTRGHRLEFFDDEGAAVRFVVLGPEERAIGADGIDAWVIFSPAPTEVSQRRLRYFLHDAAVPVWEAFTTGEPVYFTPDGDALVLATRTEHRDRFSRIIDDDGGKVQVVGGEAGDVRGELPIFPTVARLTGDGASLAILRDRELFVIGRDGRLRWKADVPIDNLMTRTGLSHLATGGDLVVVCGTGNEADPRGLSGTLHPRREERIQTYDATGKLLWEVEVPSSEDIRFYAACAIAADGSILASLRDSERETHVTLSEARTGQTIVEQTVRRRTGVRTLSVAPDGSLTSLVFGDLHSWVVAWNREGRLVWDGALPLRCQTAKLAAGGLLVGEQWVVRLSAGN